MDYEAEQQMEIEALEAILMDDLTGAHASNCLSDSARQPEPGSLADHVQVHAAFDGPLPDGWPSGTQCHKIAVRPESSEASTSEPGEKGHVQPAL